MPCKNEEKNIANCLSAIIQQDKSNLIEVIVVDNGSEDGTITILKGFGPEVKVLSMPDASIAKVRNYGARYATANWLAFIDSDVEVAHDWLETLLSALERESNAGIDIKKLVTGSTCNIPQDSSWIERVWFAQLTARDSGGNSYINSGHLIVHKSLFEVVGGFDPSLKTGEDEAFCEEAAKRGGIIRKVPEICAIHYGYPKTLRGFFIRERWHGFGMVKHINKPWRYRDLMLALYNWALLILLGALFISGVPLKWSLPLIAVCLVCPLFVLSMFRSNGNILAALKLTLIFLVYSGAKTVALGNILMQRFCRISAGG